MKVLSVLSELVFKRFPPVGASYHLYFSPAIAPNAANVADDPAHIKDPVEVGIPELRLTVIVTAFDVAGLPVKQGVALEVITQVTISLFANAAFV